MALPLPPAGEPVALGGGRAASERHLAALAPYRVHLFQSGTAALAAALRVAAAGRPDPEVLLPAYACPDLVGAAVHAGVRPVPVDLEPGRPWLDLAHLERRIGPRTVAVTAVHFLGLPERMAELRALTRRHRIALIEDSAQAMPLAPAVWHGDYVVLSFGRGKPVSLLGGGALLTAPDQPAPPAAPPVPRAGPAAEFGFLLKALAYNALRSRRLYWLPTALPFLRLGETRYRPLPAIRPLDGARYRRLGRNLERYGARPATAQQHLRAALAHLPEHIVTDLARACRTADPPRLLRYPLLFATPALRERAWQRLTAAGLGASTLYPAALPDLPGVAAHMADGHFPQARHFARTLLTLPTHSGVDAAAVRAIAAILSALTRE